jgi:hypothetical protein
MFSVTDQVSPLSDPGSPEEAGFEDSMMTLA